MNDALNEALASLNSGLDYAALIEKVRYEFFSADNNGKAFALSMQGINQGYSYPLFFYVVGFCYYNGLDVEKNVDKARAYFFKGAEYRDLEGEYLENSYSDNCKIILIEDYALNRPGRKMIDNAIALQYYQLLQDTKFKEDATGLIAIMYMREEFGCQNLQKAAQLIQTLDQSNNPEIRRKAEALWREYSVHTDKLKKANKKGLFSRLFG